MADGLRTTPLGDSPGGVPQTDTDQPQRWITGDSVLARLILTFLLSLRLLEIAELALSAAGMTWLTLTHLVRMTPGPAIFPSLMVGGFVARRLYLRTTTTSVEIETERN